jgi:pyruvate/2-oxoglutarate dehydrogenase complex dihydrolipoamide dehydrogenase (E3) component
MHAKVVIKNMVSPFKKKFDAHHIAWVIYTTPQIATFGITRHNAVEEGYSVLTKQFDHDDRAIVDEYTNGFSTVYVNKQGEIKGGTMVSENAGEISQELILAMTSTISLSKLFNKVYPYPTASRINKQIAGDWEEKRLTKGAVSLLRFLYRLF